jgi:ABC-type lipoprotein release transport system permease subunit
MHGVRYGLIQRFTALFRRRRLEQDLDAELSAHLEMAVERNLARGMNAEQARRALVVMTVASLAACRWLAWRATRTRPARALRD